MLGRTSALALLTLAALPSCTHDGADDPAVSATGAGIPIGAIGAAGVSFDAPPSPAGTEAPLGARTRPRGGPRTLPAPMPLDPFADPPDTSGDTGLDGGSSRPPVSSPPPRHAHKPRGTTL